MPSPEPSPSGGPADKAREPAAEGGTPEPRKQRVFSEEVKQQQVSHWDWDYLPREELERLAAEGPETPDATPSDA